jgi:hypothetical protein
MIDDLIIDVIIDDWSIASSSMHYFTGSIVESMRQMMSQCLDDQMIEPMRKSSIIDPHM